MYNPILAIVMAYLLGIRNAHAEPKTETNPDSATAYKIEISFGNAHLFSGSLNDAIDGNLASYLPAQSSLFLLEWLHNQWSVVLAGNLPWMGQPVLVDGELVTIEFSPSVFAGLRGSPVAYHLESRAIVELQLTALVGRTIASSQGDIFFPLLGTRLHVSRPDGFAMYFGTMFSLERESTSLVYGVGNRF